MAEQQDSQNQAEPSMEEILASIRRIISDDEKTAEPPAPDDVLELTQMVEADGSVVAVPTPEEPIKVETPAPKIEEPVFVAPIEDIPVMAMNDSLLSNNTASSANSSLAALANVVNMERMASSSTTVTPIGNGARTLENMVMDLMRPMLKEWLDANLPAIVEKLVQKEIERIAKHASGE